MDKTYHIEHLGENNEAIDDVNRTAESESVTTGAVRTGRFQV